MLPREREEAARRVLAPAVYDFIAGGADDEVTLAANERAYGRIGLLPRVLTSPVGRGLDVTLLGCPLSMPVLIAPTAFHCLAHPEGERATSRAAAAAGTVMIVSMASTVALEELAGTGCLWFQLYVQPDLGFTESLVRRAEAAGCRALVVSVDAPVFGHRERDHRNGFHDLPDGMRCANLDGRRIEFWPELGWEHIGWLRSVTSLPIVLKGIMHPGDAARAVAEGVSAIMVSNHGGRQLDTVPPAVELLPAVSAAVGAAAPVLLDGGIRRGTDVVKALALGASAVGIGRPVLWGLAVDGEKGVTAVLEDLRAELDRALALCGCTSVAGIGPDLVRVPSCGC